MIRTHPLHGLGHSLGHPTHGRSGGGGFAPPVPSYTGTMVETEDADFRYYQLLTSGDLTFSKSGKVPYEGVGGGGGGGSRDGSNATGGGGASFPFSGVADVDAETTYPIVVGAKGVAVSNSRGTTGGTTTAFGQTALGGPGGAHGTSGADRLGLAGPCGSGAWHGFTVTAFRAIGDPGGNGAVGANNEGGAGGGAGGDALESAGAGLLSTPGPGVTSIFGDTICEGGPCVLRSANANGVDATTYGSGGQGSGGDTFGTALLGGDGGAGRVVLRIPKNYEPGEVSIDELAYSPFPMALNSALTTGTVHISGSAPAGVASVDVRAIRDVGGTAACDWQTISCAGDGSFSGTFDVPETGNDRLKYQARITGTQDMFTNDSLFTVGIITVWLVQSNGELPWSQTGAQATPAETLEVYGPNSTSVVHFGGVGQTFSFNPPLTSPTANGPSGVVYLNDLATAAGVPVTAIVGGRSGTGIDILVDPEQLPWQRLVASINAISPAFIHALEVVQGENDNGSADTFEADWLDVVKGARTSIAALTGQTADSMILHVQSIGTTNAVPADPDNNFGRFRYQQQQVADFGGTNVFHSAHMHNLNRMDDFHYRPLANLRRFKIAARMLAFRLGVATDPGRFYISALSRATGRLTLTLTHGLGTDFTIETMEHAEEGGANSDYTSPTATAEIDSFQYSTDGGATWTAFAGASVTRATATTIHCDDAAIVTTGTLHFRYFPLRDSEGVVIDNSGLFVPLELTDPAGVAVT